MQDLLFYGVACAFLLGIACSVLQAGPVVTEVPKAFANLVGEEAELTGTVVHPPDARESSMRITIEIEREGERTNLLVAVPRYESVRIGDVVTVVGKVERPEPFEAGGGRMFAYDRFLAKDGVTLMIQRGAVEVKGTSPSPWLRFLRVLGSIRAWFMGSLERALPDPESALAAGIIVGGKQGLGKELLDAFTVAGMLQLVVLSGYNVAIVADGVFKVLSRLPKRIATGAAAFSIACFVLAAGAGSAALRAGLMAIIALLARATGRTYLAVRVLVLTLVLISLWNPLMLVYDPGLQFSFLATLGLMLGTPMVEEWLSWIRHEATRALIATGIAAQLGVLPMLLWQTGNLSIVSLPANVLATPAIAPAMALSAIAGVLAYPLSLISPTLPLLVGLPAYALLAYVIKIAEYFAAMPFAQVMIPTFPFWVVPAAYGILGVLVWRGPKSTSPAELSGASAAGY